MFVDNDFVVDFVCSDIMATSEYFKAFGVENNLPDISSKNSPIKYPNYLLNYESPKGSDRIKVLNVRY